MKNIIKDLDGCQKEMEVTAEWGDVLGDYDDVVADYMQAGLPGFRPGKIPKALVEKRYKLKIAADVADRSAKRIFKEIMVQSDLDFTGVAEVSDINFTNGEGLTFKAQFTVVPEFELPDYKAYKPNKDEDDPEDALTQYLLSSSKLEIPESMIDYEANFAEEGESEEAARQSAAERVKLLLILKKISNVEGIEVENSDLDERIAAMAVEYDMTVDQLLASLNQSNAMPRIRSFLLAEHTIAYLLEQ
ncbi:MAG: hypothetical protein KAI74_06355 [Kiritimatiellae bacterium]|nr:hypothetical protein [Kiritimatiellia bacterium]